MVEELCVRARHICAGLVIAAFAASAGFAQPVTPTYTVTFGDATTFQNQILKTDGKFGWTITPGADSYQNEIYERPTTQSFENMTAAAGGSFVGSKEYYQNLDIASGRAGYDSTYLYVAINMVGLNNVTENGSQTAQGLAYNYMFLMALAGDGANGVMLVTDGASSTAYTSQKLSGYRDTNGDVGGSGAANGLSITKSDNVGAAIGDGFDLGIIVDGKLLSGPNAGLEILFARVNPLDPTEVEFALNYAALGYNATDLIAILSGLGFLDLRAIKGGPKDEENFLWNDEYTAAQAGSPYIVPGTQNIYEADTLRLAASTAVPEPGTWGLMLLGFGAIGYSMRRRRKATSFVRVG